MERAKLKELGLTDEQIEAVMTDHGKAVTAALDGKTALNTRVTELEGELAKYADYSDLKAEVETLRAGNDELLANELLKEGVGCLLHNYILLGVQEYISAAVIYDTRLDVHIGYGVRGVHVSDKAYPFDLALAVCGKSAVYVSELIHLCLKAEGDKLLSQETTELQLLCRGGSGFGCLVGHGGVFNIF